MRAPNGDQLDRSESWLLTGERIEALCDLERMTRTSMGARLGVSQGYVSQLVNGARAVSPEFARRLASEFNVPVTFFERDDTPGHEAAVTYRKRSSTSIRDDKRIVRLYATAAKVWHQAASSTRRPAATLPTAGEAENDPEIAAELVRKRVGLGDGAPVKNMTRLSERLGVAVVDNLDPTNAGARDHVGISRPAAMAPHPLVALADRPPGGVARLTVGHELGHLIFDCDRPVPIAGSRSMEERRAYRFAGAVLVPADVMRDEVDERTPLRAFLRLKATYGVNVSALIQRAGDLKLISKDRKRSLFVQMSSQGWRRAEPGNIAQERPILFKQALERRWPRMTITQAAEATGAPAKYLRAWVSDFDHPRGVVPPEQRDAKVIDLGDFMSRRATSENAG